MLQNKFNPNLGMHVIPIPPLIPYGRMGQAYIHLAIDHDEDDKINVKFNGL